MMGEVSLETVSLNIYTCSWRDKFIYIYIYIYIYKFISYVYIYLYIYVIYIYIYILYIYLYVGQIVKSFHKWNISEVDGKICQNKKHPTLTQIPSWAQLSTWGRLED